MCWDPLARRKDQFCMMHIYWFIIAKSPVLCISSRSIILKNIGFWNGTMYGWHQPPTHTHTSYVCVLGAGGLPGSPRPFVKISGHSSSLKILPSPLTSYRVTDAAIWDDLVILWCSILVMQCLCCKWKSCQSLLEMKVLHLSTHLLSACSQNPASMGQWQMKAQIGSVREDITVFSFESVWCFTLWWFGHYFMSIIKKTSNKMLNSESDHRTRNVCVLTASLAYILYTCVCVSVAEVYLHELS